MTTAFNPRSRKGADLYLGPHANPPLDLALQLHDTWSAWIAFQHSNKLNSVFQNDTPREVASLQHSKLQDSYDSFFPPLDDFTPSHLSPLSPYGAESGMMMVEASIREFSFLADFSGPLTENKLRGFEKQVRTYQEDLAIGVRNIDSRTVKPGSSEALLRLISFLVYLSSNSLLGVQEFETEELETLNPLDRLVGWLHDSRMEWVLSQLLDLKTSTTEIFGSMVFRSAAKLGLTEMVRNFIDKGVDVNSVEGDSSKRETVLKLAVTHNQIDIVGLLLQTGADLKPCKGAQYLDSILYRALYGPDRIEMMQTLLQNGADVNEYDNEYDNYEDFEDLEYGRGSVLSHAVSGKDHAMTLMLLKAGAHVNVIRGDSRSPLHDAVENEDVEMVQILIDAGAEINGTTQMFLAAQCGWAAQCGRRLFGDLLATPIQLASQVNNPKLVQMLLDEGADPCRAVQQKTCRNDHYDTFPTVLQSAVGHRNAVTAQMLLKAHADVNDRAGHSGPPLAIAAANADLKTVQILLRHGSNVNVPAKGFPGSATALQAAAKTGNLDVINILLDNGADVNADAGPIKGRTALQAAAEDGNFELVKFLISKGADLNAGPGLEMGVTCLQAAVGQGHVDLALFLLDNGAFVNSPAAARSGGVTALQAALKLFIRDSNCKKADEAKEHSHFVLVKALLNAGADLNSPCSPGRSLSTLTIAVLSSQLDLVHFLLENGLHPNPCVSYRSPLGEAVAQDDSNIVRCLINARTDVDAWYEIERHPRVCPNSISNYNFSGTPLQVAALNGNVEIAGLLLDAGAEIGVLYNPSPSYTALQYAAQGNRTQIVKYLLDKDADPNVYTVSDPPAGNDVTFLSPLELLFSRFRSLNLDAIAALIDAGADANPTSGHRQTPSLSLFERAAKKNDAGPEVFQLLLKGRASVNWTYDGNTVLQSVAKHNRVDMVETLLNAGAILNAPAGPNSGRTALQHATETGNLEMVKLLLSHGADVNAPAGRVKGITALQGAMLKGSLKMVLTLLEAGADINDAPAVIEGRTALEAAAEWGRLDIVHLLLNNDKEPDTIEARCKRAAELAAKKHHSTIARDLRQHRPRR